jgi:hypothetical protein
MTTALDLPDKQDWTDDDLASLPKDLPRASVPIG